MPSEQVSRTQSAGAAANSGRAEEFLQSENFGGLNVQSSDLNIPLEDSPNLMNIKVDINGNLRKRDGSVYRGSVSDPAGIVMVPYTLRTGEDILIIKEGTSLKVELLPKEDELGEIEELYEATNVWVAGAADIRADWIVTSESTPRAIFVCSVNVPIQLQVIEQTVSLDGTSDVDVTDARFENIAFGDVKVIHDNTAYDCNAKSGTSPDFTYTLTSGTPTGTGVIVAFAWQWWAEAILYEGSMTFDSNIRGTVDPTDRAVAIPSNLLRGVSGDARFLENTNPGRLPMLVYREMRALPTTPTQYSWASNFVPGSSTSFAYSYGQIPGTSNPEYITPGSTHVTFGGVGGSVVPIYFLRFIQLNFNGAERSAAGDDIVVYVDDGEWSHDATGARINYSAGSNQYFTANTFAAITASNVASDWIRLDATMPMGFPEFHRGRILNVGNSTYVGSGATEDIAKGANEYLDGYAIGAYGLQDFANYSGTGGFPTCIELFQDRIVLAGFPNFPNTVLFSSSSDSKSPGEFYWDYQVALGDGLADAAFDRTLDVKADQKIVALKSWQSQLFAFTQDSVFRLWGGDVNIDVTPTNCFTSIIARQGAKNPESVITTDTNILFLSRNGIYAIVSTDETGGYSLQNIGLKIRPIVEERDKFNDSSAWMLWDDRQSELYLALSDTNQVFTATRLFVLNVARAAWTEYSLTNNYFFSVAGANVDDRVIIVHNPFDNYNTSGTAPTDSGYLLEMNQPYNGDMVQEPTNADPITLSTARWYEVTHTTRQEQRRYEVNVESVAAAHAFKPLPLEAVEDLIVTIDGTPQTFGTDYIKTPDDAIFLITDTVPDGDTLLITQKNHDKEHPITVFVDNLPIVETTDYTIDQNSNSPRVDFVSTPNGSAVIRMETQFPAYYYSPFFIRQMIGNNKRVQQLYCFFKNDRYNAVWTEADANASASQDPDEIADKYKQRIDFSVALVYNNTTYGDSATDIYTSDDGVYEIGTYTGIESPNTRFYKHSRFTVPVYGHAYGFQVVIYGFDENTFEMVGYQLKTMNVSKQSAARRFNI